MTEDTRALVSVARNYASERVNQYRDRLEYGEHRHTAIRKQWRELLHAWVAIRDTLATEIAMIKHPNDRKRWLR